MKKTIITIVEDITREDIEMVLENGWCYWGSLDWDSDRYKAVRAKIVEGGDNNLYLEKILAQMIIDEDKIWIVDEEEEKCYPLTKKMFIEGYAKYFHIYENNGWGTGEDYWDGCHADAVMQCAVFGEIIYG